LPSSGDDIENTVAANGGEDWKMWMDVKGRKSTSCDWCAFNTSRFSLTEAVYRKGTIGRAKDLLPSLTTTLTESTMFLRSQNLSNTSKFSLPVIRISLLYKIMKEQVFMKGCIKQIQRL
jgi:enoyl-[acyl-carrier protein] reductase/trans-2-enoyl-CoA reductase (NAD+)